MNVEIKRTMLQEIVDLGLNKNHFVIFENKKIDCYHLIEKFNDYEVFYFDERGNKDFVSEFSDLNRAKEYLIDLSKLRNGDKPFFTRINNKTLFNNSKSEIMNLIEKELELHNEDDKLITLKKLMNKLDFEDLDNTKRDIIDFLITKSIHLKKKLFEQVFIFINSIV